jgi:hypothetical protein
MANTLTTLTSQQLLAAAAIREKIDALEKEFAVILNVTPEAPVTVRKAGRPRKQAMALVKPIKRKRRMSAAGRANIIAGVKARWAKAKAAVQPAVAAAVVAKKAKRKPSAAARAKMAAAAKARWAKAKAAGKESL